MQAQTRPKVSRRTFRILVHHDVGNFMSSGMQEA